MPITCTAINCMQIPGLRGISPVKLLQKSVRKFLDQDMATYAAAVAYHLLFSLFPFVIFSIALLGFLELSNFFEWLRQQAQAFFVEQTMLQVNQLLDQLQQRRRGLLSFGAIVALWAASSGMRAVMNALNVVYGVKEERPAWERYALSILYTLGLGALLILAAALLLITPQAMRWLADQAGLPHFFTALWTWWLRWPVVLLLLTLAVAVVYDVAPDVEQRFRFITPGAFLAVLVWIAASLAFNFYVRNLADYNAMYGSVGTMIMLLLYFFISSVVLLFGAEINAVVEHHARTGKQPGEKKLR
jgi:membrane protein